MRSHKLERESQHSSWRRQASQTFQRPSTWFTLLEYAFKLFDSLSELGTLILRMVCLLNGNGNNNNKYDDQEYDDDDDDVHYDDCSDPISSQLCLVMAPVIESD